jgi:hypothetical protein
MLNRPKARRPEMQLSVTFPHIKCYAQLVQKILIGINISVSTSMIDGIEQLETLSHTVKQGPKPVDSVAHRTRLDPRHRMVRAAALFTSRWRSDLSPEFRANHS